MIPRSQLDPVALKIQALIPLPNRPGQTNNFQQNFFGKTGGQAIQHEDRPQPQLDAEARVLLLAQDQQRLDPARRSADPDHGRSARPRRRPASGSLAGGRRHWRGLLVWPGAKSATGGSRRATAAAPERRIIYYQDPTGKPDFSPEPKRDDEGHDYVPVYEDAAEPAAPPALARGERKVLYYRNPMGAPDTSPTPKKNFHGDGLHPGLCRCGW